MKIIIIAFFSTIGSIAFFGCSKISNTGTSVQSSYTMKGTVNGVSWNAVCFAQSWKNYYGDNFVEITSGDTAVYPYIVINIPLNTDLVGTKGIKDPFVNPTGSTLTNAYGEIDSSNNQFTDALYGSLTITKKTPDIVGSFTLTCHDSTKIIASFTCKAP